MAETSEVSKPALDYLFGDRSDFKSDEGPNAFLRQLDGKLRAVAAGPEGCRRRG